MTNSDIRNIETVPDRDYGLRATAFNEDYWSGGQPLAIKTDTSAAHMPAFILDGAPPPTAYGYGGPPNGGYAGSIEARQGGSPGHHNHHRKHLQGLKGQHNSNKTEADKDDCSDDDLTENLNGTAFSQKDGDYVDRSGAWSGGDDRRRRDANGAASRDTEDQEARGQKPGEDLEHHFYEYGLLHGNTESEKVPDESNPATTAKNYSDNLDYKDRKDDRDGKDSAWSAVDSVGDTAANILSTAAVDAELFLLAPPLAGSKLAHDIGRIFD